MEFGYWDENFTKWDIFADNGITWWTTDEFFSFDKLVHIGTSSWDAFPGLELNDWMNPPFPYEVVSETETKKILINEDGVLAEVPRDGHQTIPHYLKPSIVTPDDWKRCKEERFQFDDDARIPDPLEVLKQHPADRDYPLGIGCGSMIGKIRDMLTFEGLAYACYDYPDMVEDMVETCCQLAERSLDKLLPHIQFDFAAGWEDICFKNGPIVSVDFFKEVVMPRYKRISKKLLAHGVDIWYIDCDGDVRPILPYFLEGGVNCLFPFEVNGCSHPAELLREYKGALRIMGGVDKMQLGSGKEAIKAYLETLVPLVNDGGYIPFCDHRCPPNVPPEDYLYYLDLKEKLFGMK
jgi:uroporphyrinogen decarboxylase